MSPLLVRSLIAMFLALATAACISDGSIALDEAPDAELDDTGVEPVDGSNAGEDVGDTPDQALGLEDATPDGPELGPPDYGRLDAEVADSDAPDAEPCVYVHPQPDCSPATLGHPDGVPVPYEVVSAGFEGELDPQKVHISPDCWLPIEGIGSTVVTDDPGFFALQRCHGDAQPEPSGIDWATWRLAFYPTQESPETSVLWVLDDGGTLVVGADLPQYCGGPAPGQGLVAVLLPVGDAEVSERLAACYTGDGLSCCACDVVCDPEPRRLDCECPP